MTTPQPASVDPIVHQLVIINRLNLKAFSAESKEALIFIILNDTLHAVRYDRALLWDMAGKHPELLGVSGQSTFDKHATITTQWTALVNGIKDPAKPQVFEAKRLSEGEELSQEEQEKTTFILWFPILAHDKLVLGLWLERWNEPHKEETTPQAMTMINDLLMKSYGTAWEKFTTRFSLKGIYLNKTVGVSLLIILLFVLFLVRIPLRVVAPCEITPKDPVLITAPLQGIIAKIHVDPGEQVREGELLIEYDKRVPLQDLKVAQKEVQITQAEVNRAITLGLEENQPQSLAELAILSLKLEKAKLNLDLAEYYASQLNITAPQTGIVMLDDPDSWQGKPVQIGEKILTINNPAKSKIRIWLPEDDNIVLDPKRPIKVFLNINPEKSRPASLTYIAFDSTISEKHLPSFIAEAEWIKPPQAIKMGLKGTAILYGEKVTIFYFLARKPWGVIRRLLGF